VEYELQRITQEGGFSGDKKSTIRTTLKLPIPKSQVILNQAAELLADDFKPSFVGKHISITHTCHLYVQHDSWNEWGTGKCVKLPIKINQADQSHLNNSNSSENSYDGEELKKSVNWRGSTNTLGITSTTKPSSSSSMATGTFEANKVEVDIVSGVSSTVQN